jgi:hypothetical protein
MHRAGQEEGERNRKYSKVRGSRKKQEIFESKGSRKKYSRGRRRRKSQKYLKADEVEKGRSV